MAGLPVNGSPIYVRLWTQFGNLGLQRLHLYRRALKAGEQFEAAVRQLLDTGDRKFVLDATTLDYIDSAALVAALTNVKNAGGDLRLADAKDRILRLFTMTGVDKLLAATRASPTPRRLPKSASIRNSPFIPSSSPGDGNAVAAARATV